MKIICPGCQKEYEIEERRIPAKGLRMRCTGCQTTIPVAPPGAAAAPVHGTTPTAPPPMGAALPHPPARPRSAVPTLQGFIPPPAAPPMPAAPLAFPGAGGGHAALDPFADLPAAKGRLSDPFADLPMAKTATADPFADLPAPMPPGGGTARGGGFASPGQGSFTDLPAPKGSDPFADLSLPPPPSPGFAPQGVVDLPGRRVDGGVDLPAVRPPGFGGVDLPAPQARGAATPPGANDPFADLDLPPPRVGPALTPQAPAGIPIPGAGHAGDPLHLASSPQPKATLSGIAPAPPKIAPPAAPPAPQPFTPSLAPPIEESQPPSERKGGTAFGELDLGESVAPASDTTRSRPEGYRSPPKEFGAEAAVDLETIRPSRPSSLPKAMRLVPPAPSVAARPAQRRGGAAFLLVGVLVLVAAGLVPYALGYGPFGIEAFTGGEEGGPGANVALQQGPASPTEGPAADASSEATDSPTGAAPTAGDELWGDLPRVDERFLARPDKLVDGVEFEDYIASGEALLVLQDSLFMTKERYERLLATRAFNELVPMPPRKALLHLRDLAMRAFDLALNRVQHVRALYGIGRVALLSGDVKKAQSAFEKAVGIEPTSVELLFGKVEAILADLAGDRFQRAERVLGQLDGLVPGNPRLLVLWGDVNVGYQSYRRADESYRKAVGAVGGTVPHPDGEAQVREGECAGDACPQEAGTENPDAEPETGADAAPAEATAADGMPEPPPERVTERVYTRAVEFYALIASKKRAGEITELDPEFPGPPEKYLDVATALYEQGRPRLAQPLPLDAAWGVALTKFALSSGAATIRERARTALELAREESRDLLVQLLDPLYYLGLVYYHERRIDDARGVFEEIQKQDDTYPGVFMMVVQLSHSPDSLADQLVTNQTRLADDPTNPELLLRVGVSAFYAGKTDLAVEELNAILAQNPDAPDANHYLGRIYLARGDLSNAKTHLQRAIENTATPVASYYLYLGWLLDKENDFEAAIRNLKLAKDLDGTTWEAFWRLGEIYSRLRIEDSSDPTYGTASRMLERAAELNPRSASVQASLGRYEEQTSNPEAAIARYRSALSLAESSRELAPADLAGIHASLGNLLADSAPDEAVASFRKALGIGIELEEAARKEGRPTYKLAARWYWEAAYRLANLLRDQGDLPRAAAYYRWVQPYVAGQPEETTVRQRLGVIMQVVPASQVPEPDAMRAMSELP